MSADIKDLLGSSSMNETFIKNVDVVFVIEASEKISHIIEDIKKLDFSVEGLLDHLSWRSREAIKKIRYRLVWFNGTSNSNTKSSQFYTVPGEETKLIECLNIISFEEASAIDCMSLEVLLNAMNSNFVEDGDEVYHIIVVFSESSVSWKSDEEHEKMIELLAKQWCTPSFTPFGVSKISDSSNINDVTRKNFIARKNLILFTPDETPWDELELVLEDTIRVDIDYTSNNTSTMETLKKWIASSVGPVWDW